MKNRIINNVERRKRSITLGCLVRLASDLKLKTLSVSKHRWTRTTASPQDWDCVSNSDVFVVVNILKDSCCILTRIGPRWTFTRSIERLT